MLGLEGIDVAFCRIPFTMDYDDFIVLCTDGITEAENTEGEQYGKNRLLKIVSEIPNSTDAESICEIIKKDVDSFIGAQPVDDDITLVVVKRVKETHDEVEDLEIIEDAESVDEIEEL